MPLARLAQYRHCLMRKNSVRTRWMNHIGPDGHMRIGELIATMRDQWLARKVDSEEMA